MAKPKLQLTFKQQQQLALTQSMQQSLKILEMPVTQLEELLQKKKASFDENLVAKSTLYDHLMAQAREVFDENELLDAEQIIGNLDEKGFYTGIATPLLQKIQQFDPLGIAASGPKEALIIQAKGKARELLQKHYKDFLKQRWEKIAKTMHIPTEEIVRIVQEEIHPLHPFPGFPFAPDENRIVLPDIIIDENRIEISGSDGEATSERWILQALRNRKKTLLHLTQLLLKTEKEFFSGNTTHPKGSTLHYLAEKLDLTESTLSRAMQEKWIQCSMGMFPLKHFLKKNLGPKEKLKQLISQEETPLSDEELARRLKALGTPISRRTVTKYRDELGIGSIYERKTK
ncbi:MAG: RNA polymerase factor sigma-54 [Chlamydiales bacterium]